MASWLRRLVKQQNLSVLSLGHFTSPKLLQTVVVPSLRNKAVFENFLFSERRFIRYLTFKILIALEKCAHTELQR